MTQETINLITALRVRIADRLAHTTMSNPSDKRLMQDMIDLCDALLLSATYENAA